MICKLRIFFHNKQVYSFEILSTNLTLTHIYVLNTTHYDLLSSKVYMFAYNSKKPDITHTKNCEQHILF